MLLVAKVQNRKDIKKINLLCKLISEIFDIKNMTCGFALVFPFFTVSIENTATKKIIHGAMELGTLDVVIKVGYIKHLSYVYSIKFR